MNEPDGGTLSHRFDYLGWNVGFFQNLRLLMSVLRNQINTINQEKNVDFE